MNFTLIILTVILIIVVIMLLFMFINKLNKKRISQNTKSTCNEGNKNEPINTNISYPSFSDQIHIPINLDRSLLEIEEVGKTYPIKNNDEKTYENNPNDNFQAQLIRNSEFIF